MQTSERVTDGVTVVALRGDFDAVGAPPVEKRLSGEHLAGGVEGYYVSRPAGD